MIIHEITHIALCSAVAYIGYRYHHSVWVWIASFASGFLVDADHLIDYLIYHEGLHFNLAEFASGSYFEKAGRIFTFLHSYEIAMVLIVVAVFLSVKHQKHHAIILYAIVASLTLHLLYDTIYYKPDWNTYLLSSRISHNFNLNDFHFH